MIVKVDDINVVVERINNDINGNPKYRVQTDWAQNFEILRKYAKKLGFRKVRNKEEFIVTSYNIQEDITDLVKEYFTYNHK
jgi:hypothetical protein